MNRERDNAIARFDGPAKVSGKALYAGDQFQPSQLYAAFVTSPIPCGRVETVSSVAALAKPGVVRVLTATDMSRVHSALQQVSVPPLASRFVPMQENEIMHEGQPVAIVLAETLEAAEEAAKLVQVRYSRSAFSLAETSSPAAVMPEKGNYSKAGPLAFAKGDTGAAYAAASTKSTATYTQPSRHANPMEPSAILAVWNADRLTVYDSVQHLPAVQSALAAVFGLPSTNVRVISPHTGGGFGAKAFIWSHEILACIAAKVVQRPVKLVLNRQNMYSIVGPQPQLTQEVSLGANAEGRLQSLEHKVSNVTGQTDDYVEFATASSRAFYACDNIKVSQQVRRGNMVLPTFMRSPWDGPGSWGLGAAMDELARTLKIDPLDLRLKNYAEVEPESGKTWSSKKLREAYSLGAERFGWRMRPEGEPAMGIGGSDAEWLTAARGRPVSTPPPASACARTEPPKSNPASATSEPDPRRSFRRSPRRCLACPPRESRHSLAIPICLIPAPPMVRAQRSAPAQPFNLQRSESANNWLGSRHGPLRTLSCATDACSSAKNRVR
jgi:xanthine dehydrogenase YagR molybdenum-binding subunit